MKLIECIEDYGHYLRFEQGVTASTFKGYASHLRRLVRWMEANGYPVPMLSDFSTPVLRRFMYSLAGGGLRPRSVRGVFHPVIGLGEYLLKNGAIKENPAKAIGLPKKDAAVRLTVTEEQLRLLLDACERQSNPRKVALSRAVFSIFIFGGLRRAECLLLKLGDVDYNAGSILVRSGKGQKSRKIYICAECIAALREWEAVRPAGCRHDWLFALDTNRRIADDGLRVMVEQVAAIAGLKGNEAIKPHSIRHAAATRLLRAGADIKTIQAYLGHTMLQTTAVYLHTNEEQMRGAGELTALHPQTPAPAQQEGRANTSHQQRAVASDRREAMRRRIAR